MPSKHNGYTRIVRFLLAAGVAICAAGSPAGVSWAREPAQAPVRSSYLPKTGMPLSAAPLWREAARGREADKPGRPAGMLTARNGKSRDRVHRRWQEAPPEDRSRLEQRMERWNRMPPQEREQYRHRYEQYRRLSPEERRRLQRDLDRWDQLSPQQRESIRKKFNN